MALHRTDADETKGPSSDLIDTILEMKRRNPRFGCRKIAEQISSAFGIDINKDIVRRILIQHYRPLPGGEGLSWLTVIGHARDNLWSVDLFRCESILLRSFWVMVVMDVFTRRNIGFGVAAANLDGPLICRMFGRPHRNFFPQITRQCFVSTDGFRTFGYLKFTRLKPFSVRPVLMLSLRD